MKYIYIVLFTVITTVSFAQQNSPYSRFGIGQLQPKEQAHLRAMGYISSAYVDSVSTNLANPATLGAKQLSSFDIGLNLNYRTIKDQNTKADYTEGGVSYLAYSFPVNKKKTWGMAVGAQPLSSKRYDVTTASVNDTYFRDFEGNGNTYKLFLQNGVEVAENFRVGVDAGIFFGTLKDDTYNNYLSTGANSFGRRTKQKLRGYEFNLGTQYTADLKDGLDLTLGGTYQLESKINNTVTNEDFFYTISSSEKLENGLIKVLGRTEFGRETNTNKTELTLPSRATFGAFLRKPEKWSLGVDAKFGLWEDFKTVNDDSNNNYQNEMEFNLGGSFIPKYRNPKKVYEAFEYRYGGYYKQSYLSILGQSINDYGFTLGSSFPIKRNIPGQRVRSIPSSIDLGINIGQMGTIENNLVQDSYIKGTVGLNLNDIWFQKRKYD